MYKYRVKKDKRQEAIDFILEKGVQRPARIKNMVYEQKAMYISQWSRYFNVDDIDYFLEPVDKDGNVIVPKTIEIPNITGELSEAYRSPSAPTEKGYTYKVEMDNAVVVKAEDIGVIVDEPVKEPTQEEIEEYYGI